MASSSISSSKRSTQECYCKRPAVLRRSTTTSNPGRLIWGCGNWKVKDKNCGYFRLDDRVKDEDHARMNQQMRRDEINYMNKVEDIDKMKYAMYPMVGFLSGLLVGFFLGFLLAKL